MSNWFSSTSSTDQISERVTSLRGLPNYRVLGMKIESFATPQVGTAFALGSLSTVGVIVLYTRCFKRIRTSDWVHPRLIAKRKWIKGVVTSVGDGDGFRLYHTPGPFWTWPLKLRRVPSNAKELKDETIHIRLAGVDAPEAAHFGKQAQPYAAEALNWLKREIEGKRLWVQLIRLDCLVGCYYFFLPNGGKTGGSKWQVSIPIHPSRLPFFPASASRCVSISMLNAGYATTYEQSGAEYGQWGKNKFFHYEEAARVMRKGMWASDSVLELPAEYKKRHKAGDIVDPKTVPDTTNKGYRSTRRGRNNNWTRLTPFWK